MSCKVLRGVEEEAIQRSTVPPEPYSGTVPRFGAGTVPRFVAENTSGYGNRHWV